MFNIDMLFLEWMISLEGSVLTAFFKLVSIIANETLYLIVISISYWCVSKRKAFHMIVMLCFSGYIGIVIKEFMKIPRPYTYDGIQSLYEKSAASYSFPSTHVQLATTFWGSFMILYKKRIIWMIGIVFIILVSISRLYLRVHWLSDIIGAVLFSVIVVYLYTKVTMGLSDRKFILLQRIILAVSLIMYVMTSQVDNLKLLGVLTGSTIGIMLENHFINMNESNDFKMQVVKTVLGLSILLVVQLLLKKVIPDMYYLRYVLTGFTITFLCPFMFHMLRIKNVSSK
ncbi:phosphatase PAP2 family protein [Bacillus cereus group sp. BfR-BA-00331]|uniref:phosphatase PAP2 family protein n=1 Tax=Bacillus cereus group TaxID=86661 RepID=UPI0007727960|nr:MULTISPECIES: phosphatase PAP2 family protein [Bacillus cereus group]ONG65159.1 phosphatidic acid phosphatase [Bacillus cereus]MCH5437005.1 phosphatase PAP2 family protein [Bacillus paranthracis]MCM0004320.1 phosphatase PAP2 family protein [Bacillus paranthracis]MDA1956802.1 phosphatase PAP2 family protein [Bacillus cereus group sp. BcHK114]MDA2194170.1 phosphatase PAP2 family protein [Bacillus cereus group sp. Bc238]